MSIEHKLERRALYEDVITFPATIGGAAASTVVSSEMYDFETLGTFGEVVVTVGAADFSKITNTVDVNIYVSWDGGTTYLLAAVDTTLVSTSLYPVATKIPIAPRIKVEAVIATADELAADHGCFVDVELREYAPDFRKTIFTNYDALAASYTNPIADQYVPGTSAYIPSSIDDLQEVHMFMSIADLSKITDDVKYFIQSSHDGTSWYSVLAEQDEIAAGGALYAFDSTETNLGKYVRTMVRIDETAGAITTGHGINITLVAIY